MARFIHQHALVFCLVVAIHFVGLAAALAVTTEPVPEAIKPPAIMAVLVQTPKPEPTPTPPPVKPQEPVKPQTPVKPAPKQKPKPVSKPLPKAPPSERAVQAPTPVEAPVKTPAKKASPPPPKPAPVQPPSADAQGLQNKAPVYPQMSRKKKEQGTVWLLLEVKADGSVGDISIKQSSGFSRLDQAARQAVKKWQFEPARKNGTAIDFWYEMPVNFALNP